MPLAAGALDRRITVLRNFPSTNALNEAVEDWVGIATVWASKEDVSDGERARADETAATITTRFQVRWSHLVASVDERDRVKFNGRTYNISAVKEIGRREGLEISAEARAETPA